MGKLLSYSIAMRIIILDNDIKSAKRLKEDIEFHSKWEIFADIASNEAEVEKLLENPTAPYGAFLIDQKLDRGKRGLEVMTRLVDRSPQTEAFLFTTNAGESIGYEALNAGATAYFDRVNYMLDELMLRLRAIQSVQAFDAALKGIEDGNQQVDEVAEAIVKNSVLLGFERARLWKYDTAKQELEGWAQHGNEGLDAFRGFKADIKNALHLKKVVQGNDYVMSLENPYADQSSRLAKRFGKSGYKDTSGPWAALALRWDNKIKACLVLDSEKVQNSKIDLIRRRYLIRFAQHVSADLANAHAQAKIKQWENLHKEVEKLLADDSGKAALDNILKRIIDELWNEDANIRKTEIRIVLIDKLSGTADYRASRRAGVSQQPLRRNLEAPYITSYLLKSKQDQPVLLSTEKEISDFRGKFNLKQHNPSYSYIYVPFLARDKVVGAVILDNDQDPHVQYTNHQVKLLEKATAQMGVILETGRLRELAEKTNKRQKTLTEAHKKIAEFLKEIKPNPDGTEKKQPYADIWLLTLSVITMGNGIGLNRAIYFEHCRNNVYAPCVGIGNFDRSKDEELGKEFTANPSKYTLQAWVDEFMLGKRIASEIEKAIENKDFKEIPAQQFPHLQTISDQWKRGNSDDLKYGYADDKKLSAHRCAYIPVQVGDVQLGVVYVDNHVYGGHLTDDDLNDATTLLSHAAQAITAHKEKQDNEKIFSLAADDFKIGNLKDHLQRICDDTLKITDADFVSIGVLPKDYAIDDNDSFEVHPLVSSGSNRHQLRRECRANGLTHTVLKEGMIFARDLEAENASVILGEPLRDHGWIQEEGFKGFIGAALKDDKTQKYYGVLFLGYRRPVKNTKLDQDHTIFLKHTARRAIREHWDRDEHSEQRNKEMRAQEILTQFASAEGTSTENLARKAAELLSDLIGQDYAVTLLNWHPATKNSLAKPYYKHYQSSGSSEISYDINPKEPILFEKIWAFNSENSQQNEFDDKYKQKLNRFRKSFATELENVQRNEHMRAVLAAAQTMTSPLTTQFQLQETLDKIIQSICHVAPDVDGIALFYQDSEDPDCFHFNSWGALVATNYETSDDKVYRQEGYFYLNELLKSKQPKYLNDALKSEPGSKFIKNNGIISTAHIPLIVSEQNINDSKSENIGVLFLNYKHLHSFTQEEKFIFNLLAQIAATEIFSAKISSKKRFNEYIVGFTAQYQEISHEINRLARDAKRDLDLFQKEYENNDEKLKSISRSINEILEQMVYTYNETRLLKIKITEIQDCISIAINKINDNIIKITYEWHDENIYVEARISALQTILGHLINNAAKKELNVKNIIIGSTKSEGGFIDIYVSDDGKGIDSRLESIILKEPIKKEKSADDRYDESPSSGYGLLFARYKARSIGGELKYVPKKQNRVQGATFVVSLLESQQQEDNQ